MVEERVKWILLWMAIGYLAIDGFLKFFRFI